MLRADRKDAALARFETASRLFMIQPDAPRLRPGATPVRKRPARGATKHFQTLLKQQPSHPPALLGLARIRRGRGRRTESPALLARVRR